MIAVLTFPKLWTTYEQQARHIVLGALKYSFYEQNQA